MEMNSTSRTLEEGSSDSKLIYSDNSVHKTLKANDSALDEESYVKLPTKENNANNQLNIGPSNVNSDVFFSEGELKFSSNHEIQIEEIFGKGNPMYSHEPGSPTKIEVSENGNNLILEVSDPFDKVGESNNDMNVVMKQEECAFHVTDLVWVKTRTQLWLPGMISYTSKADQDSTQSEKSGSFLVKYFGSATVVWCSNSDLKPFIEYFDQMSGQEDSRSFRGSLEKALNEIGRRVKSKMTCPCFSKESQTLAAECVSKDKEIENKSKFDILSLSQFEPSSFLARVKNLARADSLPGEIESTIIKSRLSAFYCSIGHHQIPMRSLRPVVHDDTIPNNGNDDVTPSRRKRTQNDDSDPAPIISPCKDSETRQRKKSKYLCYPYVIDADQNLEDTSIVSEKSTPLGNKKTQKIGSSHSFKERQIVKKSDSVNASSSELLSELRSLALGCGKNKKSDSLERFYRSLRIFTFLDAGAAEIVISAQQSSSGEDASKKTRKKRKKVGEETSTSQIDRSSDLNGNNPSFENGTHLPEISPNINSVDQSISLPGRDIKPRQKRRRIKSESSPNGEDLGAILFLNFSKESTLPSKEALIATFSRFGLLKKDSEIQFLDDSNVEIVYERCSDAQFAYRSLGRSKPFGESLMSFKFDRIVVDPTAVKEDKSVHKPQPHPSVSVDPVKVPAEKGESRDLNFMKQNLEMMKMTLEKAGDDLSPEMRAKLENEIKGFLNKISSMDAGSSSPSSNA